MMKIGPELLKVLAKVYEPSSTVDTTFQRYDLTIKTDDAGRPVLLFIGKRDTQGKIKGTRFARRLVTDNASMVIRDHWDNKGKV
jgi:hypothetical protein